MSDKKTVTIRFTIEQYDLIKLEASTRCLKPPEFIKLTVASYINKSSKGAFAKLARQDTQTNQK